MKPRFTIHKNRISGESETEDTFSPDKILYTEIDDEITDICERVRTTREKNIALVIPTRANLFQSTVNLKILKKKSADLEKNIVIVTNDEAGRHMIAKAGLASIKRLFEEKKTKIAESKQPETPPRFYGERPMRRYGEKKKMSLSEIIQPDKPSLLLLLISRLKEKWIKRKQSRTRIVLVTPNKQALFTLILVSVLLLLAIAYIALPGATIYITPRSSILDPAFNITFLDYGKNIELLENESGSQLVLASFPVKPPPFIKKYIHKATGKKFRGQNAHGIITVTNKSAAPWDLAAQTRFQTEDGLIFRTPFPVRIPVGTLDIEVIADPFDTFGQPVGTRGNIGPSRFFLPGLKSEESRKKLYAESKTQMNGGITDITKMASAEDIAAANEYIKRQVRKDAADDLTRYLEQQNLVEKTNLSLLADRNAITVDEPKINIDENIVDAEMEQFEISYEYSAQGIAFDRQLLIEMIKERLRNRVDPDKKIIKINEDDISYRFLDKDERIGRVRLTATMRALQVYELDPEKENGRRFFKKITDHIASMRVKDAIEYLQQQTNEIANIEIRTWPLWAPTIPSIAENIKFAVREENEENDL